MYSDDVPSITTSPATPLVNAHLQEPTYFSTTDTIFTEPHRPTRRDTAASRFTGEPFSERGSPGPSTKRAPRRTLTIDPHAPQEYIPKPDKDRRRTLILCFDGTGDQFDADNSNVVHFVSLLKKDNRDHQRVYYQSGIGTYTSPEVATPLRSTISKTVDLMFAWNLDAHVMDGYEFLMQNYNAGDKVCVFGFSRGAYIARSLAGMLHKVGLLPADNFQQVPFAYKMYSRVDLFGWQQSNAFKRAFSTNVGIDFLGVWDTVDSVGIIPKRLPFTKSNTSVKVFRHAVSLDERRAKFKANLWQPADEHESKMGLSNHSLPLVIPTSCENPDSPKRNDVAEEGDVIIEDSDSKRKSTHSLISPTWKGLDGDKELDAFEMFFSKDERKVTDVEEVWFAGCHSDVGGGSVDNKTRHSLARISLRWMIRECFKLNTGIMFNTKGLYRLGLDPSGLYPIVVPRPPPLSGEGQVIKKPFGEQTLRKLSKKIATLKAKSNIDRKAIAEFLDKEDREIARVGTEEEEELRDALSPIYDQLKYTKGWWFLEVIPLVLRTQKGRDHAWKSRFGFNFAEPRHIPGQHANGLKVHRSVKIRSEALKESGEHYKPRPEFRIEPEWID